MALFVGDFNRCSFRYESGTYASPMATANWIGMVQNHELDENKNVISLRFTGNSDRNVDQFVDGPEDYTGTVSYFPQDWKGLMFTLGSNVDAGSPSPYTHVISETNSNNTNAFTSGTNAPFISFTVQDEQRFNPTGLNFIRTIKGGMVDSYTINMTQGEPLSCELGYVAQSVDFSSGVGLTVTDPGTRPFMWHDARVHIPSGTVYAETRDVTVTINNNLDPRRYVNTADGKLIDRPIPNNREYEISMTFDGNTTRTPTVYEQYLKSGTEFNMMIEVNAGTGTRDAYMVFSGCKLTDFSAPTGNESTVNEQTFTIKPKSMSVNINDTIFRYNPW